MILGFFRLVFYLVVAYVIYLFLRLLLSPRRPVRRHPNPPQQPSGVMVKDQICNTYLPREDAILEKAEGKDYYFCSQECRKKFLEQRKPRS